MMGGAFLDHHGDPAAQLVIAFSMASVCFSRRKSRLPQTFSRGTSFLASSPSFIEGVRPDRGIVRVDARNFIRVDCGPIVLVDSAPTHADEGRLLRQPMLLREVCVPGIPRLAGVGRDEGDVKTPPEQFDLGLGLVVPVTASPGPRVAGGRCLRDDHDAPPLSLDLTFDPVLFVRRRLDRLERERLLVHQEVVAIEPMPGCLLAREGVSMPPRAAAPCVEHPQNRGRGGSSAQTEMAGRFRSVVMSMLLQLGLESCP